MEGLDVQLDLAASAGQRVGACVHFARARPGGRLCAVPVRLPVGGAAASVRRRDGRRSECADGGRPVSARILVVDNYDSFVFNLVQYLYQLGAECEVLRNDEVTTAHA